MNTKQDLAGEYAVNVSPKPNRSSSLLRFVWLPLGLLSSCVAASSDAKTTTSTAVGVTEAALREDIKEITIEPTETGWAVNGHIDTGDHHEVILGPGDNTPIVIPGGAMIPGAMWWNYGPSGDVHINFPAGETDWYDSSGNTVASSADVLVKLRGWTGSTTQIDVFEGGASSPTYSFTKTPTGTSDAAQVLLIPRAPGVWILQVTNQYKRVEVTVGH